MKRWLVLLALFASVASSQEPRDVVTLTVTPRLALTGTLRRLTVRVENPDELRCPLVEVEWPDSTRSQRESDCDPDGKAENVSESWPFMFPAGEYTIRVRVARGARSVRREVTVITR